MIAFIFRWKFSMSIKTRMQFMFDVYAFNFMRWPISLWHPLDDIDSRLIPLEKKIEYDLEKMSIFHPIIKFHPLFLQQFSASPSNRLPSISESRYSVHTQHIQHRRYRCHRTEHKLIKSFTKFYFENSIFHRNVYYVMNMTAIYSHPPTTFPCAVRM